MIDRLSAKGMESYVSNEPATFFQMAHYLLTKGDISHLIPVLAESAGDLDNRAKVHRGCQYMWGNIDRGRRLGGSQTFISDLGFYLLVLGWFSVVLNFDKDTGFLQAQIWNPADVFPRYVNDRMASCVHTYKISQSEAIAKAQANGWNYNPSGLKGMGYGGNDNNTVLSDFFVQQGDTWYNMVLIDSQDVTGLVPRPEMNLIVAPVGGYPDRGTLAPNTDWRTLVGKGIFEVNEAVATSFNKWKSMLSQILRDTVQPIKQEFSASPQATPEQIRERGALFHYAPGEQGLQNVQAPTIPVELQAILQELRREMQKGSFNDAVYGMMAGQPGYALSLLASSSANQILYPFMDGKHFVLSEADRFWLSNLKKSGKTFLIKSKLLEKIEPKDIPEDVVVMVESDVATPTDWLERGTIAGMVRPDLDQSTLISQVYKLPDPQGIMRRKKLDAILEHPMSLNIEMIASYKAHANYLEQSGDREQAMLFRNAARALEAQLNTPPPGSVNPAEANRVNAQVTAGTPASVPTVPSNVQSPEAGAGGGIGTPQNLRKSIGRGTLKAVGSSAPTSLSEMLQGGR